MNEAVSGELGELCVGFVGCGNMGGAIARGLAASEEAPRIVAFDTAAHKLEALAEVDGIEAVETADRVAELSDLVVLSVKPNVIKKVLDKIRWPAAPRIVVSVAAGTRLSSLRSLAPRSVALVRVMPNTPATVGAGVSAVLRHRDPLVHARTCTLLEACGEVVTLEREDLFDAVTAVSGSGPAYAFVAIEAMADGGVRAGLPRETALHLATQTLLGAARLVAETGEHPGALKDAVASPAGTTIEGLAALERGGFRAALLDAVAAAAQRSREMGQDD